MNNKRYLYKLSSLNPITEGEWRPLIKVGNYGEHFLYGEIKFTPKMLAEMYNNFKNNVVGREISFNYEHDSRSPAALWIKDLRLVEDENGITALEYLPEYTPSGLELIRGKEYKYVSLEYVENYNGLGATLFGGACTNDPFIVGDGLTELKKEGKMNKKERKEQVNLEKKQEEIINKLTKELEKTNEALDKMKEEKLNYQIKSYRSIWQNEGIPLSMIDCASEFLLKSKNPAIKLSNEEDVSLLTFIGGLFNAIPSSLKVNLTQASERVIKREEKAKPKENILLKDIKRRNK